MGRTRTLICGVGVNDADYITQPTVDGKKSQCHFYTTWKSMLTRCYSEKFKLRKPTYADCTVSSDWCSFMVFKKWMETQDWQGKALDKDLLFSGNKIYSPKTCAFVDLMTNNFTTSNAATRGDFPIGVYLDKRCQKFQAQCWNPFTEKQERRGGFTCPQQAHQAWRQRKHQLACQLADLQSDARVAEALRKRYA